MRSIVILQRNGLFTNAVQCVQECVRELNGLVVQKCIRLDPEQQYVAIVSPSDLFRGSLKDKCSVGPLGAMALSSSGAPQSLDTQPKYLSLLFYQAVRDLKPVWMLEDMRTMETFYQEAGDTQRTYNPSEALLYAIVHDHQAYAQYLLSNYTDEALSRPGERFCCCRSSAPHLAMTVRYDRRYILGLILQEVRRTPSVPSYTDQGGCLHVEDGKTPLHLACELARPEAVTMLLGNGASPRVEDHQGMTPLDVLLARFREPSSVKSAERRRCLDNLLMFMPAECHFKMKGVLDQEPDYWSKALGEATFQYLVGRTPAALVLAAMQTVLRQLSPAGFPDSLHELPIPSSLKPLSLPSSSSSSGHHRERLRMRLV